MKKNRILRTGLWATIGAGLLASYGVSADVNAAPAKPAAKKAAAAPKAFDGNIAQSPIPLANGENVLYTVGQDGRLNWQKHTMKVGMVKIPGTTKTKRGLIHTMSKSQQIGTGWKMKQVFPGGQGVIYGINDTGDLRWFRHNGWQTGKYDWEPDTMIGNGWQNFRKVISMGDGVMYAWQTDGQMRWYKYNRYQWGYVGNELWDAPLMVGDRWNFSDYFAGGNGVIYGVTEDGKLMWFRHRNYQNAVMVPPRNPQLFMESWEGPKQIGTGWDQFTNVFSPGYGEIYAIKPTGELMYFQHLGYRNGAAKWGESAIIAKNWGDDLIAYAFARIKTNDPLP